MDRIAARKKLIGSLSPIMKQLLYTKHVIFTDRNNKEEKEYGVLYRWLAIPNTTDKAMAKIETYQALINLDKQLTTLIDDFVEKNASFFLRNEDIEVETSGEDFLSNKLNEVLGATTDNSQIKLEDAIKEVIAESDEF